MCGVVCLTLHAARVRRLRPLFIAAPIADSEADTDPRPSVETVVEMALDLPAAHPICFQYDNLRTWCIYKRNLCIVLPV
jgi:hypothetical protein